VLGPISDELVHEGESLDGGALDHIDDHTPNDPLQFLSISEGIHHSAGNRPAQRVPNHYHVLL
jgi:hypothetical protein